MAAAGRNRETEVKIRIQNPSKLRARLKQLGAVRIHPRALEDNVLFDTTDRVLRKVRSVLRLRQYAGRWTVTYKGTPDADPFYKSRVELESVVGNPQAMRAIFLMLGMVPVFRYQKYRTEFALWGPRQKREPILVIALDETPIGCFIELEGGRRAIDRTAGQLGYSRTDYSTASYGALYLEDCTRRGAKATDMVFPANRKAVRPKN